MMLPAFLQDFAYAPMLPEIFLSVAAILLLLAGAFGDGKQSTKSGWLAILMLAVTAMLVAAQSDTPTSLFDDAVKFDPFGRFMKLLILAGSAVTILMSFSYLRSTKLLKFEFPVLIMLATVGMMLMASANNLIALYMALEMQSLTLYVLAAFRRDTTASSEAGLKYFILGALSSGLLLYGCSLIYGFTGTTSFTGIATALAAPEHSVGLTFGLVFVLTGIAFKIAAVPFHMWTPDVYQGAPTPVTAFFAAAPKVAAFALLIRVLQDAFPAASVASEWKQIVMVLSVASMLLGSFAAIMQTNIKRLMAYSSIGHAGYALVGLVSGAPSDSYGISGVMIYLAIYVAMTLGTFACILAMRRDGEFVENISDLSGLARTQPMLAFMLAMLLFSMAGIPPLAGFFAKWYVFLAAIKAELYWLAAIGIVTSVVSAFYYLAIIARMYFAEPAPRFDAMPTSLRFVVGISGIIVLFLFIPLNSLVVAAEAAAKSLF
ncbi:MAG: NADH-quinone oxidoreductase subunit NuoN [Alphaproteobacteria bacterium]